MRGAVALQDQRFEFLRADRREVFDGARDVHAAWLDVIRLVECRGRLAARGGDFVFIHQFRPHGLTAARFPLAGVDDFGLFPGSGRRHQIEPVRQRQP